MIKGARALALKVRQCAIIALRPLAHSVEDAARCDEAELRCSAPSWLAARRCSAAKYLGLMLGPGASWAMQWATPMAKHDRHMMTLAASALAPSTAIREYNRRILPVTSYVAQFSPLCAADERRGRVVTTRLLHMPANSVPRGVAIDLRRIGMPKIRKREIAAHSALLGEASRLRTSWLIAWGALERATEADMPLHRWAEAAPVPPGWQAAAIVQVWR